LIQWQICQAAATHTVNYMLWGSTANSPCFWGWRHFLKMSIPTYSNNCAHRIGHFIYNPELQMGLSRKKDHTTLFPKKAHKPLMNVAELYSWLHTALDFQCLDGEHDAAKRMLLCWHFASCSYSFIRVDQLQVWNRFILWTSPLDLTAEKWDSVAVGILSRVMQQAATVLYNSMTYVAFCSLKSLSRGTRCTRWTTLDLQQEEAFMNTTRKSSKGMIGCGLWLFILQTALTQNAR
jgi:hypothetical protein